MEKLSAAQQIRFASLQLAVSAGSYRRWSRKDIQAAAVRFAEQIKDGTVMPEREEPVPAANDGNGLAPDLGLEEGEE